MSKILTAFFLFTILNNISAQDFSNKGKDFWVGYGYHQGMNSGNSQDMILYFSAETAATVTVDIPGIGWSQTYNVPANTVLESAPMPKSGTQDATLKAEGTYNKGIHITSDVPIVAYAHIYNQSVSGATLLFPVNTLGQDYYSLNFTQKSNTSNSNSWAFVVATEDNTTVEITPSAQTLTHAAGTAFTITLNKGQIYNLMGIAAGNTGADLTGTHIRSISSGTSSCKKIAVFSGAGRMSIYCNASNATTSDNLIQQVFPRVAWGKKYLTVPTIGLTNNYFRVAVSDPSTVVSVNGTPLTGLVNGFYYEFAANVPKSITADKPVMVAQYITSTNNGNVATCGNTYNQKGDPEMIYISPVEQTIDTISLYSSDKFAITEHHINVVIKTADKANFTIDGASTNAFVTHPQDPLYSYASLTVNSGQHKLQAAGGFNAIAYGYGNFESYGYNAGTNIKDLYTYISLQNQFDLVNIPSTCTNTNFLLAITLPYQPTSITWDFSGAASSLSPNANVVISSPVADSSFIKDGKTLYVYKIPGSYAFTTAGNFPIKIINVNPTADGCSGQQEIIFNVQVGAPPTADFNFSHSGCFTSPVQFTDNTYGSGRLLKKWFWNFGDATTDTLQNPLKTYSASGVFQVKLKAVNDIGCSNEIIKPFTIEPQPTAKFGVSDTVCTGTIVKFTDSSTITSGSIVKWRWAFGPGDSVINTTNSPVTKVYNTSGSFTVTLVVENSSGCKSTVFSKTFFVNSLPVPNFDMPGVCLPAGIAQFTNLSTIAGGNINSMTYVWNFGDGGTSTNITPTHNYVAAGPFTVKLSATSIAGCTKDSSKIFNNIYAQPKAGFTFNSPIACSGDSLTFNDTTKAIGSSVSQWFWNFSDGTTSSIKNPGKKFPGLDTVIVTLFIKTAAGCNSDTTKRIIPFNKLPKALFNITGTTCQGQTFTLNDQSLSNSGVITNWYWYFGNGTSSSFTNGNPFTKKYDTAGTYTIKLIVKTDKGCKSDTAKTTLTVIQTPVVKFGLPAICQNDPFALFTDSSSIPGGGSLTHFWNFGDANATPSNPNTSTTVNGQHNYSIAGTYNVSLQVGTVSGCSSVLTKSFTVNSQPKADFKILNSGSLCGNATAQIKDSSTINIGVITRLEIIWDSINNPSVVVQELLPVQGKIYTNIYPSSSNSITYKVVVRAFSGQTCMSEKTGNITVVPTPKVKFNPITEFCLNDPARILNEASETIGVPGIGAYFGDGITAGGIFNPVVAGPGLTNIKYVFTSNNGCTDSASQIINVVANPVIQITSKQYVLEGGSVTLSPSITGNPSKYVWSPSTFLNNTNTQKPLSKPTSNITYQLIASTAGGCSDSATVSIVVLNAPKIPNAFSPNGDGVNDKWDIASLSSYPGCTVEVFNRYGQQVFSSTGYSKPWDGTKNGTALPTGVYYYIINPKNGRNVFTGSLTIVK